MKIFGGLLNFSPPITCFGTNTCTAGGYMILLVNVKILLRETSHTPKMSPFIRKTGMNIRKNCSTMLTGEKKLIVL